MPNRRQFCAAAATSIGLGPLAVRSATASHNVDIGIYVTRRAIDKYGGEHAITLSNVAEEVFRETLPDFEYNIGPAKVVNTPTETTWGINRAQLWWKGADVAEYDSSLLVFASDQVDWDPDRGLASYERPWAVCLGYEKMNKKLFQQLALHEIGHTMGLEHEDGYAENGEMSIMQCCLAEYEPVLEFSDESTDRLDY